MRTGVRVEGLKEFRQALQSSIDANPRELAKAIRAADEPVRKRAQEIAPRRSGRLADSAKLSVRATSGTVSFTSPYAAGAEFGTRGKWKGFAKYGPRARRFAFRALEEKGDEVVRIIAFGLQKIISVHGWFR